MVSVVVRLVIFLAGPAAPPAPSTTVPQVQVAPNTSLPGTSQLVSLVGGMMTVALVACIFGMVIAGATWAFAERRANVTVAHSARRFAEGALLGAMLIGAAVALVNHAFGLGVSI